MIEGGLSRAGVTPSGGVGVISPVIRGGSYGPWGGSFSGVTFTNTNSWNYEILTIDTVESNPAAGDWMSVGLVDGAGHTTWFFSTSVGTGHTGDFHDQYNGHLILGNGEKITIKGAATGTGAWTLLANGYIFVPLLWAVLGSP